MPTPTKEAAEEAIMAVPSTPASTTPSNDQPTSTQHGRAQAVDHGTPQSQRQNGLQPQQPRGPQAPQDVRPYNQQLAVIPLRQRQFERMVPGLHNVLADGGWFWVGPYNASGKRQSRSAAPDQKWYLMAHMIDWVQLTAPPRRELSHVPPPQFGRVPLGSQRPPLVSTQQGEPPSIIPALSIIHGDGGWFCTGPYNLFGQPMSRAVASHMMWYLSAHMCQWRQPETGPHGTALIQPPPGLRRSGPSPPGYDRGGPHLPEFARDGAAPPLADISGPPPPGSVSGRPEYHRPEHSDSPSTRSPPSKRERTNGDSSNITLPSTHTMVPATTQPSPIMSKCSSDDGEIDKQNMNEGHTVAQKTITETM